MRVIRFVSAAVATLALLILSGCQSGHAKGKLQVFYSGNLRGSYKPCGCHTPKGGLARWAAYINRHGDPQAAWLVVDAGNFVDRQSGGGCSKTCQFMLTSYKDLRYNVLNLGKHEVGVGYEALHTMLDTSRTVDFISANLVSTGNKKPVAKPYVIKDYGNLKVGIVGLLNEADFPRGTMLIDTTHFAVLPAIETAKRIVPSLARKTDAVLLLGELSSAMIDSLVKVVPDIDLVISTGGLRTGETIAVNGKTRILGTGSSGYNGHYAMLEFDPAWKDSVAVQTHQDLLVDTYDEKGEWADRIASFGTSTSIPTKTEISGSKQVVPHG